jgi:hypothetical protein
MDDGGGSGGGGGGGGGGGDDDDDDCSFHDTFQSISHLFLLFHFCFFL